MAQVVTYRLNETKGEGILISDTFYMDNGVRKNVVLKKAGDVIDASIVDPGSFAKSSLFGQIQHHVYTSKRMVTAVQEVAELVADRINGALEAHRRPMLGATPTHVKEIEPGLQIAVAMVPEPPHAAPALEETPFEGTESSGTVVGPVASGTVIEPEASESSTSAVDESPSWKDNLDYASQKATILQSKDPTFLQGLIDDEKETAQFKKLAKTVLAELTAASK